MNKPGAPKGNQNARKDSRKDAVIFVRVTDQERAQAETKAAKAGMSLPAWVRHIIKES